MIEFRNFPPNPSRKTVNFRMYSQTGSHEHLAQLRHVVCGLNVEHRTHRYNRLACTSGSQAYSLTSHILFPPCQ